MSRPNHVALIISKEDAVILQRAQVLGEFKLITNKDSPGGEDKEQLRLRANAIIKQALEQIDLS